MPRRTRKPSTKAGRNERRKLVATLLNNFGVAAALAGLLQPTLSFLRSGQRLAEGDVVAALVLGVIGAIFHLAAHQVVGRLED